MMTNKNINLTKEQEACVNYKGGDLLVKGVAGSGKSYVLLRRALKLYYDSDGEASIRIFTFTNALVQYTDELLQDKMGGKYIEVSTVDKYFQTIFEVITKRKFYSADKKFMECISQAFYEHKKNSTNKKHRFYKVDSEYWCEEFIWIQEKCIKTEDEYLKTSRKGRGSQIKIATESDKKMVWEIYSLTKKKMDMKKYKVWPGLYLFINENKDKIPEEYKVDYVFIDEAQDLTIGKLCALKAITKKTITIAADMAQKIYKTTFTWKEVGIDIQGRSSKSLKKSFRSTKQIVLLAEDLAAINRKDSSLKDELTEAVFPDSEGPLPELYLFPSKVLEETFFVDYVKWLLKNKNFSQDTIGIICKTRKYFFHIRNLLSEARIKYQEIFRSKGYYPEWKLLVPGVKLVVAKSSKGLEFDTVLIPDFDEGAYPLIPYSIDEDQIDEHILTERNLMYVEMTRARKRLIMFCTKRNQSRFIKEFVASHYSVTEYDDNLKVVSYY